MVEPTLRYDAKAVKRIRHNLRLPQRAFAKLCGVSNKTVEAWESEETCRTAAPVVYLSSSRRIRRYSLAKECSWHLERAENSFENATVQLNTTS